MQRLRTIAAVVVTATLTAVGMGEANAALHSRTGGMIYDDVHNITWLSDLNFAKTSGYDTDGLMAWTQAKEWAENLSYGGFNNWRLPSLNPADSSCSEYSRYLEGTYGTGCTGGELSHLFVADLGNKPFESVLATTGDTAVQKANLAMFSSLNSDLYWSGVEISAHPELSMVFRSYNGHQDGTYKFFELYAVAVHPGDIAAVPEPQTQTMLLAGLAVAAAAAMRRSTHRQK